MPHPGDADQVDDRVGVAHGAADPLALLVPELVEAILGGWADQRVMLEQLERPLPMGWEEQRRTVARSQSAMAHR